QALGRQRHQQLGALRQQRPALGRGDPFRRLVGLGPPVDQQERQTQQNRPADNTEQQPERAVERPELRVAHPRGYDIANDRGDYKGRDENNQRGRDIGHHGDGNPFAGDWLDILKGIERDQGRRDPAADRQQLAHDAAAERQQPRDDDDRDDDEIEGVHRGPSGSVANRRTSSARCLSARVSRPSAPRPRAARRLAGRMARLKPSFAASLMRLSIWLTGRTSPDSPSSPKTTVPAGNGWLVREEMTAAATARSAAGSLMRRPPATFRYTSRPASARPHRASSTASTMGRRPASQPTTAR